MPGGQGAVVVDAVLGFGEPSRRPPARNSAALHGSDRRSAMRLCHARLSSIPLATRQTAPATTATRQLRFLCQMARYLPAPGSDREYGQQVLVKLDITS